MAHFADHSFVLGRFSEIIHYLNHPVNWKSRGMDIKGKHVIAAKVSEIYQLLQDQEVLARIAPGISRIEKVSDDQYKAISEISIGPVRGSFEGELSLTNKVEDKSMTLILQQKSKIGNAQASILMELSKGEADKTLITYKGKAKISGRLATMGQRILGGVISTLSKEVFKELDKIVEEKQEILAEEVNSEIPERRQTTTTENNINKEKSTDKNTSVRKSFIQSIIDKILSIWR